MRAAQGRLDEATGLALAIGLDVVHAESVTLNRPRPATLFGKGVVERFAGFIEAQEVGVAIVDAALTPIQQRNLELSWKCKVIDSTGMIIEIF